MPAPRSSASRRLLSQSMMEKVRQRAEENAARGSKRVRAKIKKPAEIELPPDGDWRTTDTDEINRRILRARQEALTVRNLYPEEPVYSAFRVTSGSGLEYVVEVQDLASRVFSCNCMDFRINRLGTCKHVESVLGQLQKRLGRKWQGVVEAGSPRAEIALDRDRQSLVLTGNRKRLPLKLRRVFDASGNLSADWRVEDAVDAFAASSSPGVRLAQTVLPWLERRLRTEERPMRRREYEQAVHDGKLPPQETVMPLYPYQREGMLHLAFVERGLLADEMGLGKTVQAIAACALLHRLGKVRRVLVISPASLKSEWEEQIRKFTPLDYQIVYGGRKERNLLYHEAAPFFTLMNYEQVRNDVLDLNARLRPDVVILDEAQRIKNWASQTARSVKLLQSRYAFVLTGTPLENRIDELYSLVDFLDPEIFGSLFRFNREFYDLDDRGRPAGYRNLRELHERVKPIMLRRRKSEVEDELPDRTNENRFVSMSSEQRAAYEDPKAVVMRLGAQARKRALRKEEHDILMMNLAKMRMICDTAYILDPELKACPKLAELRSIFDDCLADGETKIIVFSEWVRMLDLVQGLLKSMKIGYAVHTGKIAQKRRRAEITAFKTDPSCRVLLCTESGGTGLNLQNASVVINCDLPWNPAKLEQRIARAWRKHQKRPVTVINLVTENSIEHGMLETLAMKQGLSDGVLDLQGSLDTISLKGGGQAFLKRLELILSNRGEQAARPGHPVLLPPDRPVAFAQECASLLGNHLSSCEERYSDHAAGTVITVVVDHDAESWKPRLEELHTRLLAQASPGEPAHLVVLDQATLAAIEALQAAGLIQRTERASRPLLGDAVPPTALPLPLTPEQKAQLAALTAKLEHRLKVARALCAAELLEDATAPLEEAVFAAGSALALKNRRELPQSAAEAIVPPCSTLWPAAAAGAELPQLQETTTAAWIDLCGEVLRHLKGPADAAPAAS